MYVLLYWVSWNSSIIEHLADSNLHLYSPVMCRNELSARLFTHQTINYFTLSFASTNYWNLGSEAHAENISDKTITIYRSFSRSCKLKRRGFLCNRYSLVTRVDTFMLAQLNFHSNALPGSVFFSKISNTCQWIFIRKEKKETKWVFPSICAQTAELSPKSSLPNGHILRNSKNDVFLHRKSGLKDHVCFSVTLLQETKDALSLSVGFNLVQ